MTILRLLLTAQLVFSGLTYAQDSTTSGQFTSVETVACTGIVDRMPTGEGTIFPETTDTVYVWTKLTGALDTTSIKHVWFHGANEIASVELPVRSSSWRTWSYKSIIPDWAGDWEVKIEDSQGNVLKSVKFSIGSEPVKPDSMSPSDSTIKTDDTNK